MGWLLRRVLTVGFVLFGTCIVAIVVARISRAPGPLQAFGFDVCDGEPCFWGIRLGMDWQTVQAKTTEDQQLFSNLVEFEIENHVIAVRQDKGTVSQIKLSTRNSGTRAGRLTVGAIIAQYGPPCAVKINEIDKRKWEFSYPNSLVEMILIPGPEELGPALRKFGVPNSFIKNAITEPRLRLHMDLPVQTFTVHATKQCKVVHNALNGAWRGLTTSDIYQALYRRSAAVGR
jgi:hypothetical protein